MPPQIVADFSRMITGKADKQPSSGNGQATYKLAREKAALHIRQNVSESRKSLPIPWMRAASARANVGGSTIQKCRAPENMLKSVAP